MILQFYDIFSTNLVLETIEMIPQLLSRPLASLNIFQTTPHQRTGSWPEFRMIPELLLQSTPFLTSIYIYIRVYIFICGPSFGEGLYLHRAWILVLFGVETPSCSDLSRKTHY
ncbi:hypothetical protein H112_06925 [Trichophyton rubrum D6]|uniref:Uncharacterized protein n=3 Tax=Trichophyton TaxID=5550 RepID=A0A080WL69_TRIRC|nr:uncharacterized protein TERG_11827 [Trichophyton rubrum CBS 118892]EZF12005.1 hypothetical protein H100_06948 [Trichophyton rubrum MR850]EZF38953.1 hypothetical protein H102_06909 [Trichophyton rubrum CBS 100081]EZF49551.1 hypothetical protein H103_06933 [Trichophyton rubrum CBS 288.86]EZF60178.1 hypothetical protein H104_06888 [Trichophyton rubrum CBS 289.86]EZF70809.1 hypothetical protein H105_06948 [Trichophyton soudanense CBS 452.61]EZF81363.1 hypothetical protein H110_06929 [Trichophy